MHMYIYICTYTYIYIYIERERDSCSNKAELKPPTTCRSNKAELKPPTTCRPYRLESTTLCDRPPCRRPGTANIPDERRPDQCCE